MSDNDVCIPPWVEDAEALRLQPMEEYTAEQQWNSFFYAFS